MGCEVETRIRAARRAVAAEAATTMTTPTSYGTIPDAGHTATTTKTIEARTWGVAVNQIDARGSTKAAATAYVMMTAVTVANELLVLPPVHKSLPTDEDLHAREFNKFFPP
ncbi:Os05g0236800 [Oryza sativa Japonica Group]|uniref:Os05g0236800 protein n=1 Tax=Oryza sativa subsp. japonica TaxID=39947 RepID=A0A0P0WJQ0_ORYSJ|nr:Os05g0236800 [Oryza sativa Japonica Group]